MLPLQNIPIDYKPWGMQAGGMVGEAEADNSASNLLNIQESILGNIVKQKDASLAQDEMSNQAYRDARIQGLIGKSQQDIAKGKVDIGTADTDISAKNQKNITEVGAQKTLDTVNRLDNFLAIAKANGPAGIQIAISKLDPSHQIEVMDAIKQYGVDGTLTKMASLSDMLKKNLADSPTTRAKIAETEATGKWHQSVAGIQGKTARDVEQMRIDAGKYDQKNKSAADMWLRFQSLAPDRQYINAQAALASNRHPITGEPLTEMDRATLTQIVASAKSVLDQKAATSAAGNPNGISPAGVTGLPAQQTPTLPGISGNPPPQAGGTRVWDGQKWIVK